MNKSDELFELMTKMYSEMKEMKSDITGMKGDITRMNGDINGIKGDITGMKGDIIGMKGDITGMKGDINSLKKDVNKNLLLLEKVDSNVKLLAEGQEAFREQIGRSSAEDNRTITNRLDVVELAVKSTSNDVKFIKHKVQETEADVFTIRDHLHIVK